MTEKHTLLASITADLMAGFVVFFVALPLCLGIAQASNAPPISGLIAGIVGGIVVGLLSRSSTSVSGPAAGLTAVVASEISKLGSFETFLLAVVIAGFFQVVMALLRFGSLAAFVPASVVKGLLAAIGVILILKQLPHLLGHDQDPEGEMSFIQPDLENTISELSKVVGDLHLGAAAVGIGCLLLLIVWDKLQMTKRYRVPGPLMIVVFGVMLAQAVAMIGPAWVIDAPHLVDVPVAKDFQAIAGFLSIPNFSQAWNAAVYASALTIALIASLETLLNIEAVDKLDIKRRKTPPGRELFAQGIGNMMSGLIGGIPMTAVVVRGSANISAGAQTKLSAIFHGILLLGCVVLIPSLLNLIPKSCLAAILIALGFKLASPKLFREVWKDGLANFLQFMVTLVAIVFTDLRVGVLIGLAVSGAFALRKNAFRRREHEADPVADSGTKSP